MNSDWPLLKSPPVIMAVFQLKFTQPEGEALSKLIVNDKIIKTIFPNRQDNYHSSLNVHGTPVPGISNFKGKAETKINSYTYFTNDKLRKFQIEKDSVVVINECPYLGWRSFKQNVADCLNLISEQLNGFSMNRISIRFINKFMLETFGDPLEYFTKMISTETESFYTLTKYSFKLNISVPDTDTRAIINHSLECNNESTYDYYLDIDVLNDSNTIFDMSHIDEKIEQIRIVKNKIFFDTVKQKTLDLCN
ncbi:MAG: TIGR04255 family protein [Mariniphaga sp.]